ncbi:MAG: helix-turn-helix transcriptional regulator, partial [Firmicutes bacterium]|nr:helix-turn-helix transcriptional regulator [Candidatus Onthovivens merdipullorum]
MKKTEENEFVLYEFGKRVAYLRNLEGITQEELGFRSELEKSYIGDIEKGKRNPTFINILKISKGLNVSLEELFKGIGKIKNRR